MIFGTDAEPFGFIFGAIEARTTMWTLLALGTTAVLTPMVVVLSLFRLAELKRAEDLKAPSQADEWASSQELQTPK